MKDAEPKEKLSAPKLVDLPPTLRSRLNKAAANRNESANEIIRRGLVAELDRMDAELSIEARRMAKLNELAKAHGGDIDAVLDQLLRDHTDPALPLVHAEA